MKDFTKDFYEILEVVKEASPEDIKKAYWKKAKKMHPDVGGDEEDFKKISHAYSVISDDVKREKYDNGYDPEINIKKAASSILMTWFIYQIEYNNVASGILGRFIGYVNDKIEDNSKDKKIFQIEIGKLEKLKGKIVKKNNEENCFDLAVKAKINELKKEVSKLNSAIEIYKYLLEHIDTYKEQFAPDKNFGKKKLKAGHMGKKYEL